LVVVAVLVASSVVCGVGLAIFPPAQVRAAQNLGDKATALGDFELTERSGRKVTQVDFANRVAIVSFIFTRCPLSCPRISSVMQSLQDKLKTTNVTLVSLSVDPDYDTPAVLSEYAKRFEAAPDRWLFLTGPKPLIEDVVRKRFRVGLMDAPENEKSPTTEAIFHSDRLALVVNGKVVGLFDSTEPDALKDLVADATRYSLPGWVLALPPVNASLNGLSALLLLSGWIAIRLVRRRSSALQAGVQGRLEISAAARRGVLAHVSLMLLALTTSTIFLGCYLVYHFNAGSVSFKQPGLIKLVYLSILLSHTLLATFGVVPLVLVTLYRALRRDFYGHVRIAQVTFPIWLYVAVTGVVIYLMLYQLPHLTASTSL
jgi:protein SCO1/2/putative membrane protein